MKNKFKEMFALTERGASDLVKASFTSFLLYMINMTPAILLMIFIDQLLLGNEKSQHFYLIFSAFILLMMFLILNFDYEALYNATYRESANLRIDIAEILSKLPLSYFSKRDLSDLSQTVMQDVEAIEHAMSHSMGKTAGFFLFFPIISIILLIGNVKLGLAIILPVLLNILLIFLSKKFQVSMFNRYHNRLRENSESFQEAIEMQHEIISFGLSQKWKEELYKKMEESEKLHIKSELAAVIPSFGAGLMLYLSIASVIIVGSFMYANQEIGILYLLGYLLASMKIKEAVDGISNTVTELYYLDSKVRRIKEMRNTKIQEGEEIQIHQFGIELQEVSFGYNDDHQVLKKVSFCAEQGEVTALVGMSGCGKTSILRLVSRLYDYDRGKISISGKDLKEISTRTLFDNISIVFQDVTLFNASVLDNIRIGRENATTEEIKEASRLANCDDFINRLPQGYDTIIGENGASLSGGERQRLSIARAFLKNSPIILLDEISASLDVDNEQKIQQSLNQLTKNKTVLIISHRLKSIENADKIVVIHEGEVEAQGRHEELLQTSKTYSKLVENSKLAEEFKY